MRAIFLREITLMTRHLAFAVAVGLHVLVLVAFVLLWAGGVPQWIGQSLDAQQARVEWAVVAVLLPWAAVRLSTTERGDAAIRLRMIAGLTPARLTMARQLAACLVLLLITFAAVPAEIRAQQMSAVPFTRLLVHLVPLAGFAVMTSAVAAAWLVVCRGRLMRWLAATLSTIALLVAILTLAHTEITRALLFVATAGLIAVVVSLRTNTVWRYLSEHAG
jgi:hypothetical protein